MSTADQYVDGSAGRLASLCATASQLSSASPTSSSLFPTTEPAAAITASGPAPAAWTRPPSVSTTTDAPPRTATRSPLFQPCPHSSASHAPPRTHSQLAPSSHSRTCSPATSPPPSFLQPLSSRLPSPYDTDDPHSSHSVYHTRYRHTWRGMDSSSTTHPDSFYDPARSPSVPRERHVWLGPLERASSAPLSSACASDDDAAALRYTAAPPVPVAMQSRTLDNPEIAAGMRWLHTGQTWPQLWQAAVPRCSASAHTTPLQAQPVGVRAHALPPLRQSRRAEPSLAHILLPPPLLSDFESTEIGTTTEEADRSAPLHSAHSRAHLSEERRAFDRMPPSFREGEVYMHTNPMSGMELAVESPSGMEDTFMDSSMTSDWALHPSAAPAQDAPRQVPMKLLAEIVPMRVCSSKHTDHADSPRDFRMDIAAAQTLALQHTAQSAPTESQKPWQPYEAAATESYLLPLPLPFYRVRWAAMFHNPLSWPIWNGCTAGEAVTTVAILAQMVVTGFWWAADPAFRVNVAVTGQMSVFLLMLTCFMAVHSNVVLLLVLGLPFDRQLPWHKLLALSTVFHSVLHLLAFYIGGRADTMPDAAEAYHLFDAWSRSYGMEASGWLLFAPIITMSALGIPGVARRCYAAFFKTHVLMAAATLVGVAFHGFGAAVTAGLMPLAIPGGLLWLLDLALRAAFGTRLSSANNTKLRLVEPTVQGGAPLVAVSLPNHGAQRFTAGQWVFLCVPRLGLLHWHPFTIASSSHDPSVELAVACKGAWTRRLAKLAGSEQPVKAYLEGPYGSPMIDVHGARYKCFLLISGGIGWTFLRAWRRQLVQDARRGRPVKAVTTVAVVRATDQHHVPEITDTPAPGASAESLDIPPSLRLEEHVFMTGTRPPDALSRGELLKAYAGGYTGAPGVPVSSTSVNGVPMSSTSILGFSTKWGRPQFQEVLFSAAQSAHAQGETRVAMLICGTQAIVNSCRHCVHLDGSDIVFDIHYEVLAF